MSSLARDIICFAVPNMNLHSQAAFKCVVVLCDDEPS